MLLKNQFFRFLKDTDFAKAVVLAFCIITALLLGYVIDFMPLAIGMAIGVFLTAPSDVPGNNKHRFYSLLFAIGLVMSISLLTGFLGKSWAWWPIYFIGFFCVAFISVYGFRASLVTFSGLIAFVLGFSNLGADSVIMHTLSIGLGGFWYMGISSLYLFLFPRRRTELLLGQAVKLTADALKIRAGLEQETSREKLLKKQFKLQIELNDLHENLREALMSNRKIGGNSYYSKKRILIFIELVDILEVALSHPVSFKKVDELNSNYPEIIVILKQLINDLSQRLNHISEVLIDGRKIQLNNTSQHLINATEQLIENYKNTRPYPESRSMLLLMRNLLDFEVRQHQQILAIERTLGNLKQQPKLTLSQKQVRQFLSPTDYSFKIIKENFTFSSPIFKHSLRLALLMIVGLFIGYFFQLQNSYWILLTLVVIMRPNYGLTKERSKKRVIGTLIGGTLAVGVVFLVSSVWVFAVLAVVCLILAFSMLQKNYVGAAAFITLNVVFLYAILQPDAFSVIQYRIIDTLIGVGLAVIGNYFIFPAWEHYEMNKTIADVIKKNQAFLNEVDSYYHKKGKLPQRYKLARKEAFLSVGRLSAAFQRATQEPKSHQYKYESLYKYNVLNYTFLSSVASLGLFIRSHKTTKASPFFEAYISHINKNLNTTLAQLTDEEVNTEQDQIKLTEVEEYFLMKNDTLHQEREKEIADGQAEISLALREQMQEIQLISEQLKWLYQVSLNLKNINNKRSYERLF